MTTEEKAKAYDEALERAKAAMDMAADKDLVGGVVRTILPELAETEDERIRKQIVNIINHLGEGIIPIPENQEELLAYLEKQKEQKPSTDEAELNSIAFLERLGYTCIPPEKEEYEVFEDGNATGLRRKKQEPLDIPSSGSGAWGTTPPAYKLDIKPAEWSEEDEVMLLSAIEYVQSYPAHRQSVVNWLKSLRPKPHWKPSEEQMKALGSAIVFHKTDPFVEMWQSLYDDLQKLI